MTDEYRDFMQPEPVEQTAQTAPAEAPQTPQTPQAPQIPQAPQPRQTPPPYFRGGYDGAQSPAPGYGYPRESWSCPPPPPVPEKKAKKKGRTGKIVGIAAASLAYLVLVVLLILSLNGRSLIQPADNDSQPASQSQNEPAGSKEPKVTNPPIVTQDNGSGTGAIVNPDYTGDTMTPAQLYKENVESVVYVEALYNNGKAMGSGFVIDDVNGYILTNHHVVSAAKEVSITLVNGESYAAEVIGSDEINDIAVLKVNVSGLRKVTIGDSDAIEIGSYVNVIGNPLGELTFTITRGIIGGVGRSINTGEYNITVFQTDAAINGGNSGGPALDDTGAVIGIASAKYADVEVEGICFCIPINDAMKVANDLVNYGYVKGRPNFGITVSTSSGYTTSIDERGRFHYVETMPGALINEVYKGTCAEKAGLLPGDIVTKLDDTKITTASDLINAKLTHKVGDTVTLEVFRNEQTITISVVLDEYIPE